MFAPKSGSSKTPEVPKRRNRKDISRSGQDLHQMSQKYDRDAFAFNHYIGFLKQPLKRHLSSDISYLVPSMQLPVVQISSASPQTAMNYNTNNTPSPLNPSNDRPPLAVRYETSNTSSNQEPIYSAPRRQRSFRKQRSLDNPTNEGQLISTPGPNELSNQSGSLSVASSVPHLPISNKLQVQHQQPEQAAYTLKPLSVSTEGLIQHIISQQSQIERLSKQQDFLTQQLLLSRDTSLDAKRRGHSRARSRSTSSKTPHGDSLTSLEQVKHRSSSREKIQEQLHAQQARVQQHIQQLEAQLELIRDIRTGSSTRPSSRSHSREASIRSSCPPDDKKVSQRPLSADPKWLDSLQSDEQASSTKSNVVNLSNKLPPTTQLKARDDNGSKKDKGVKQSLSKPRLILTNPSEESKDDSEETHVFNNSSTRLVVNRPTLLDQDDGIPFMDEELNDEPDDGANESDELETVFEFERSKSTKGGYNGERNSPYKSEDDEYEDWEDDEIDFYTQDVGESPEAESDPWAQLMEEDIMRARTDMDNQRSLMERQEMELAEQRQQISSNSSRQQPSAPLPTTINKMNSKSIANESPDEQSRVSQQDSQFNVTGETFLRPNVNLISSPKSPSRSPSPIPFSMKPEAKHQPKSDTGHNYPTQFEDKQTQGNIFNFDQASIQSYQPANNVSKQQYRLSPNYTQPGTILTDPPMNRSKSPVPDNLNGLDYNYNVPPKVIDRQISTPVSYNHASAGKPISPDSNYLKRPSLENQPTDLLAQSSMLRSKMIQPSASLAASSKDAQFKVNPSNLNQTANLKQPSAPPRRKPVTPRSQSPIFGSSGASPSYRIQTNKNRMAGQTISQPKRPQRSLQTPSMEPFNQSNFNYQTNSAAFDGRLSPRAYSPKPMHRQNLSTDRSDTVFRPISSKSQPKSTPMIKIDPAQSRSNLNLSSSFTNLARRSPSPQPTKTKKPFGSSFMQRFQLMGNSEKPEQQTSSSLSPAMSPSGNTLKVDMQTIRSNRSRASSPVPPNREKSPIPKPARKVFINKDTVEAGSFVDHFNHYYAPNTEKPRRPLSQQFTNISTGDLNKIGRSVTPNRDIHSKMDSEGQLRRSGSSIKKPSNQSTVNALIDAPIHFERRQTLPEITKSLGIEDSTAKEEAILRNMAGKKKHSLPQDDLHEVPLIPGWEREKVATLAHEAREARMNQPTGPSVHLTAATNWLVKYKFTGLIIFFNALLLYMFMRILQPIDQDEKNQS